MNRRRGIRRHLFGPDDLDAAEWSDDTAGTLSTKAPPASMDGTHASLFVGPESL